PSSLPVVFSRFCEVIRMTVRKSALRAVSPADVPVPQKVSTLAEAIEAGDYLEILLAQRREIASSLPDEKGPAKAALHRQLSMISKEIEQLQSRDADEGEGGANVGYGKFDAAAVCFRVVLGRASCGVS